MSVLVESEIGCLEVPIWVNDLSSFRRWVHSDNVPEKQPLHFINGNVWVDTTMEEFFSHNRMKTLLGKALAAYVEDNDLGTYVSDGMRYTCEHIGFSTEPDGMFFSHETMNRGGVEFQSGARGEATELVGTPDLVIEVVSRSSVEKDTEWLSTNYYDAGIPEYWLIDARGPSIQFDIFKPAKNGYVATESTGGWVNSAVLNRSFKLTRGENRSKIVTYKLENR